MIHNTIHTWLEYKFKYMRLCGAYPNGVVITPLDLFKQYLNSLALAAEARLNITPNSNDNV